MPRFHTRSITSLQELNGLVSEWTNLWRRSSSATSFQRPEWLISWVEAFGPSELCVIAARQDSRLVGLAPMFIYPRGSDRVLAPIGAGITDYLDWLVDAEDGSDSIEEMFRELNHHDWHVMELLDLPNSSSLLQSGTFRDSEPCDACPVVRVPAGSAFNQVVPRAQRRNLRTAQNRISREGTWHIETANPDTLSEFLNTLIRLHRARWTQVHEPGVLADAKVQEFHHRVAPRLLDYGVLRFYGLRFEGRLIAVLQTLVEENAVYCYMQGFDPAYVDFSPGMLLLEAVIRDALREGRPVVDFLRGREKYKYAWGAQDQPTFRITVPKPAVVDVVKAA
jgi:CelD/BcsL family acetyltransferase involved in cellulose biosynthesis